MDRFRYYWEYLLVKFEEVAKSGKVEGFEMKDFLSWIATLMFKAEDEDTIYLVANNFTRKWSRDHYLEMANQLMEERFGRKKKIEILSEGEAIPLGYGQSTLPGFPVEKVVKVVARPDPDEAYRRMPKRPKVRRAKRRYGTWVRVPESEEPAYVCQMLAKGLNNDGQPLGYKFAFIYARQGIGKTHLMSEVSAIAWELEKNVVSVSAEQFMREWLAAVHHSDRSKIASFENRYRCWADLLIIDGIEFLEGKSGTLNELFTTIDTRLNHIDHKDPSRHLRTIITSTKSPKSLRDIPENLRSRFLGGYVGEIKEHSLASRIKIVKQKAADRHFNLSDNVASFMARNIHDTIRQLEGSLVRLELHSTFYSVDLSQLNDDKLAELLHDYLDVTNQVVTAEMVMELVCGCGQFNGVSVTDLKARSREHRITLPKQVAMYLLAKYTELSLGDIAKAFTRNGDGDHSMVHHAKKRIARILDGGAKSDQEKEQFPVIKAAVETVERRLPQREEAH